MVFRLLLPLLLTGAAAGPRSGDEIEIFVRAPGTKAGDPSPHQGARKILLSALRASAVDHFDVQYDQTFRFRGAPVQALIESYGPPAFCDAALLHFANGVMIPLPFRDEAAMRRLHPIIATAIRIGQGNRAWTRRFPALSRESEAYSDARPIVFKANKLVVNERWHPFVPEAVKEKFSPWMHADSLVAIELVSIEGYLRQFDVDHTPQTEHGFRLFRQSCAFCHGARGVGAKLGRDLVLPTPIYQRERPLERFYFHIKYRAPNAPQQGLMMPALDYMTLEDARGLFYWLKEIARKVMPAYEPNPSDRLN